MSDKNTKINKIKSDKKYIVKKIFNPDLLFLVDENDLFKYIKTFGDNIPISTIDKEIKAKGYWYCKTDEVKLYFTTENVNNTLEEKVKYLEEKIKELEIKINEIGDLK